MDRITVSDISVGGTGSTTITEIGATVVHSQKGFEKPIYFGAENTEQLKHYFGVPTVAYPQVAEAFDFNSYGNLYVSAPSKDGRYGAIGIPKTAAVIEYPMGVTASDINTNDFTKIMNDYKATESLAVEVGTYTVPTADLVEDSVFVYLADGTKLVFTVTPGATESYALVEAGQLPEFVSLELTRASGVLVLTLTAEADFLKIGEIGVRIDNSALFTVDGTLVVTTSTPTNIPVKIDISETLGLIDITAYEVLSGVTTNRKAYKFSLDENSLDDFGISNYLPNIISDIDPFIQVYPIDYVSTFEAQTLASQDLKGYTRGATLEGADYSTGFNYFSDRSRYLVNIFFDSSDETASVATMDSLLQGSQKNMYGIFSGIKDTAANILADGAAAKKDVTNPDMACYDSWHVMANTYGTGNILRNLTGRIAVKYAQMKDVADGLSPSYVDEGGHGGQLGAGVIEALYTDRETLKLAFDDAHINFVGRDVTYGLMIQGDRTCSSSNGDYSYIGRRRLRNLIVNHSTTVVLPLQINKPNDANHRLKIYNTSVGLVKPLIGNNLGLLDDALIVCDKSNNGPTITGANSFVLDVVVKFTPNSQRIRLNMVNVDQSTDVNDYLGA